MKTISNTIYTLWKKFKKNNFFGFLHKLLFCFRHNICHINGKIKQFETPQIFNESQNMCQIVYELNILWSDTVNNENCVLFIIITTTNSINIPEALSTFIHQFPPEKLLFSAVITQLQTIYADYCYSVQIFKNFTVILITRIRDSYAHWSESTAPTHLFNPNEFRVSAGKISSMKREIDIV